MSEYSHKLEIIDEMEQKQPLMADILKSVKVPYADEEEDYDLDVIIDELDTSSDPQNTEETAAKPTLNDSKTFNASKSNELKTEQASNEDIAPAVIANVTINEHLDTGSNDKPASENLEYTNSNGRNSTEAVAHVDVSDSKPSTSKASSSSDNNSQSDSSGRASPEISPNIMSRNLRRNSISMPSGINALDLEALRMQQVHIQDTLPEEENSERHTDSVPDELASTVTLNVPEKNTESTTINVQSNDDSDDDLYGDMRRKPQMNRFRSRRRASIAPLPALRLNSKEMLASDFDTHSLASNQASITSINSIASLLREKMQAFPQLIRKKKRETKDYKLKIFVTIMFFIIVFLIGFAYVGYHEQVLARSYFEKIKFKTHDRVLRILDQDDKEIIFGHLGTTLAMDSSPFHCLEEHRRDDGSVCMEWNGVARLYMNFENKDVFRCYTLQWQALRDDVYPTDCYELQRDNGLWFGGAMTKGMDWSLSTANFDFAPFISGDARVHQFGNGVKRYFINSIGVAIQVNEQTPLYIAANQSENRFCLRARNDDFSFVNRLTPLPELDYKICTMEDMRSLHMLMTQQSLWDGLKEDDIKILRALLEEPIWKIPYTSDLQAFNETTIYNYSEQVIDIGFMRLGHILVNEFWQENIGDFTVDRKRFPTLVDTIDVLHRRGFKVVFTIQPFISTDSPNFRDAVAKKLLIYERFSERSIPAMTRYKNATSAGIIDITNNASIPWLLEKLERLKSEFKVDSFFLDLGNAYNLPHYYQCRVTLDNPDMYAKLFTSSLESIGFIGVSSASTVPKPPSFLATPPINASWTGLREVLATVLNFGIIGYPFVLPGAIGGDFELNSKQLNNKMISFYTLGQATLPEQELYVRWMQLMTFLPSMQFSHLPSEYKSEYVMEIAKDLTSIRQKLVNPVFKKYLSDSMNEGIPLVRPLWMLDAHDPACLLVSDEFSVGEELIVAPILERDVTEREVYLPQGVWKDGIDGSLRKGSRWMHSYKVPRDKIAFFIKMPDNTRF